MLALLLVAALAGTQPAPGVKQLHSVESSAVPQTFWESADEVCGYVEPEECMQSFQERGGAWVGDLNDDGVDELLVMMPGGTGGDPYFLFGKGKQGWVPLADNGGWLALTRFPRYEILPVVRKGYHDLRIAVDTCVKWDGDKYVAYADDDYRQLSPTWFDAASLEDAEIFWAIRYRGLREFVFEPRWFAEVSKWLGTAIEDKEQDIRWAPMFKGGVYGIRGDRSFLLLPRPAYRGADELELQGDWLVIYAEEKEVARYNRRTKELQTSGAHWPQ